MVNLRATGVGAAALVVFGLIDPPGAGAREFLIHEPTHVPTSVDECAKHCPRPGGGGTYCCEYVFKKNGAVQPKASRNIMRSKHDTTKNSISNVR